MYSDKPPPANAKNVQTKRLGANFVETSQPSLAAQQASDRFPVTLYTFPCGEVCTNAEALLNRRGVPFAIVNVQADEQGMARMQAMTGDDKAPVLAVGDKLIVKGYNESRWQATLDEAGYPKTPAPRVARPQVAPPPRHLHPPRRTGSAPVADGTRALTPGPKGGDYPK